MNIAATITPSGAREDIARSIPDFVALRHELHERPELAFAETATAMLPC